MLDLALFRKPAFNGVSAVAFGLSAGMFAMFLYLTIYMQGVLDFSPLETGLRFLPLTVLSFVVAPIAGKLSQRVPIRVLMGIGLALVGAGLLSMHGLTADSDISALLPGFLVAGVGIGLTNPSIGQAAIAVVPPAKAGMGSGINTTFRQVGIATGVASLGAVFQSQVDSKLSTVLPGAPPGLAEAVASGGSRAAAGVAPARAAGRDRPRRQRRLRQRLQRDPPDRRDPLLHRRRPRLRPRPSQRFRPSFRERRGSGARPCVSASRAGGAE